LGTWSIIRDITQQKELQKRLEKHSEKLEKIVEERTSQLRDAERLATIGATAGMVGHDIRNPLQAIAGDVYLIKSDLSTLPEGEEKESMKESLAGLEKNVMYVDKIVQDLQDYARPIKPNAEEFDIEVLCEDVLFKSGLPENIEASCRVEKKAKKFIADPHVLKRILSNLVANAIQAMPNGGKIALHVRQKADDAIITVSDTGVGIPPEVKARLFTPLFTTKSKGQGFGLAVVKRMTEALGGTITFESEEGKGTKFILHLPHLKKEIDRE
jgi:signal transduction histidine kinase